MDSKNVTVIVEATVNPHWIEFCTNDTDLFRSSYCGYWLSGLVHDERLGWLCCVKMELDGEPSISDIAERPDYPDTVQAWVDGKPLPVGFYSVNKDIAIKAYKFGIEKSGLDWYENGDGSDYDCAIQKALFSEVRYG